MGYKCSTTEKRMSYPYREKYLKHNKGFLGGNYFCSQCGARLTKETMEVDHIIALKKWYGFNRLFNCVAICPKCNKEKLEKVKAKYIIRGVLAKLIEETYIFIQNIVVLIFEGAFYLLKNLLSPIKSLNKMEHSFMFRAFIISAYILVAYVIYLFCRG